MVSKILSILFLLFSSVFILKTEVSAQVCAPSIRIDAYNCRSVVDPISGEESCFHEPSGTQSVYSCNFDGSNCQTSAGVCSSNDSCDSNCNCTFSRASCWISGSGPSPTPAPGGFCGDGSCNNGESCSSCSGDCGACSVPPSCSVAFGQGTYNIKLSDQQTRVQANVSNVQGGSVNYVRFRTMDSSVFLLNDGGVPDENKDSMSSPYRTRILPQTQGTSTIRARVNMNGTNNVCQATANINITPPDLPSVDLKINNSDGPITVASGSSATLSWTTSNVIGDCSATSSAGGFSGTKAQDGGPETVTNISSPRSYTLTCPGYGGTSASDTVNVNVPGSTIDIRANNSNGPVNINSGGNVNLTWTGSSVQNCSASNAWSGTKVTNGSELRTNLISDSRFQITCQSTINGANLSDFVDVNILQPGVDIKANGSDGPIQVASGTNVTLTWESTDLASPNCSAIENSPIQTNWTTPSAKTPTNLSGQSVGPINSTRQLTIRCTEGASPFGTYQDTVQVSTFPPTVNLSIDGNVGPDVAVNYNTTPVLSWVLGSSVTSCTASANWPTPIVNPNPSSDDATLPPVTNTSFNAANTYTLTCQNSAGVSVSDTIRVRANAAPCGSVSNISTTDDQCASLPTLDNGTITWRWNQSSNGDEYLVNVLNSSNTSVLSETVPSSACSAGVCQWMATDLEPDNYRLSVIASGTSCTPNSAPVVSNPYELDVCTYQVSGHVYLYNEDDVSYNSSSNRCEFVDPSNRLGSPQGIAGVQVNLGGLNVVTGGDGSYTLTPEMTDSGNQGITISDFEPNLPFCTSNGGFSIPQEDTSDLDFYVTGVKDPWFQVQGGDVHANNDLGDNNTLVVSNPVSIACSLDPLCIPYTIIRSDSLIENTSGFLTFGSGRIDTWSNTGSQIKNVTEDDPDPNNSRATQSYIESPRETFGYLYRLHEFGLNPPSYYNASPRNPNNAQKPGGGTGPAYYQNGDITIGTPWNIGAGETVVLFVNGNVRINQEIIADDSSFIAIVASGDIIFSSDVDLAQGVFIANQTLRVESKGSDPSTDNQFVGEGTFVGWGGVEFLRDLPDNNATPAVKIVYRSEFLQNAPIGFRHKNYRWREVAP